MIKARLFSDDTSSIALSREPKQDLRTPVTITSVSCGTKRGCSGYCHQYKYSRNKDYEKNDHRIECAKGRP